MTTQLRREDHVNLAHSLDYYCDYSLAAGGRRPGVRSLVEADIERKVIAWSKARGMLPFKLNLMGNTGWPDRMWLFYHPFLCFIEFKRPGEKLRRNQPQRVAELRRRGYSVGVIDNVADGIKFLEAACLSSGGREVNGEPSVRGVVLSSGRGQDELRVYGDGYVEESGLR